MCARLDRLGQAIGKNVQRRALAPIGYGARLVASQSSRAAIGDVPVDVSSGRAVIERAGGVLRLYPRAGAPDGHQILISQPRSRDGGVSA